MKILIASDSFVYQHNGVSNVVMAMANGLRARGNEVRVLALSNKRKSFRDGDHYFIRSTKSGFYPDVRISFAHHDPLLDELRAWKPDIIHLHTEGSIARMAYHLAKKTHSPLVMTTHTDYAHFLFGRFRDTLPVRKIMTGWGWMVYRPATKVIAPSYKAEHFLQLKHVRDRITVIPNGIPLERYQKPVTPGEKEALFRQWEMEDNGCTLVMISRLSREKNIEEMIRFMPALVRRVPKVQMIIVGDGPDREHLKNLSEQMGMTDRIRMTGQVPPDEVYRYYAMGDVFVSASTFEVHSLSYLEAMAQGLPLVCRADESLLGVLSDGENGRIYRTEEEFVEAVSGILLDPEMKSRMRKNALERIGAFSEERFVDNICALYEEVLQQT